MESYRTEEEQVEALRRWWNDNGRSTVVAVVVALAAGFGWQAWQARDVGRQEQASALYQALLRAVENPGSGESAAQGMELAEQLKTEFGSSQYAQFAALQLAAIAVGDGNLAEAEVQLRWVLGRAPAGSDTAQVAQLRLARVLAASGDTDQALDILTKADPGPYGASYAVAQGDILLAAARRDEARHAYNLAATMAGGGGQGVNLSVLQQKLQSLTPVPPRLGEASAAPVDIPDVAPTLDTTDAPEE